MRRLGGVLAAAVCLAVMTGACSKGGAKGAAGRATTTTEVPMPIAFTTTSFTLEAAAEPVAGAADGARAGVEATLKRWLDDDLLPSLRTGQPAADLRPIFTGVAGDRIATTPERAAFVTEGLPPVTGLAADNAAVTILGLVGAEGTIPIATVHVDLKLHGQADGSPLTVEHTGDLFFVDQDDGWKIDGYDLRASRDTAGVATTTTAKS